MDYVRVGRGVGIGARLAGKALSKALEPSPAATRSSAREPASVGPAVGPADASPDAHRHATGHAPPRPPTFHQRSKAVASGTRKFGEAFWGPFAHAGRTLWLEVAGVFFAIFALFFGQQAWIHRASLLRGPDHASNLATAAIFAMFVYLSASSFARSRRKARTR